MPVMTAENRLVRQFSAKVRIYAAGDDVPTIIGITADLNTGLRYDKSEIATWEKLSGKTWKGYCEGGDEQRNEIIQTMAKTLSDSEQNALIEMIWHIQIDPNKLSPEDFLTHRVLFTQFIDTFSTTKLPEQNDVFFSIIDLPNDIRAPYSPRLRKNILQKQIRELRNSEATLKEIKRKEKTVHHKYLILGENAPEVMRALTEETVLVPKATLQAPDGLSVVEFESHQQLNRAMGLPDTIDKNDPKEFAKFIKQNGINRIMGFGISQEQIRLLVTLLKDIKFKGTAMLSSNESQNGDHEIYLSEERDVLYTATTLGEETGYIFVFGKTLNWG